MKKLFGLFIIILFLMCTRCTSPDKQQKYEANLVSSTNQTDEFADYWYAGKAEVSSYELHQARYGEMHDGTAVLIFVTEPFSKSKQVKLDNPDAAGDDKLTVMKLNFVKKFTTGIYPYSLMLSSFTPVDRYHHPNTVKVSMSGQEWCGNVFTQMNLKKGKAYHVQTNSYFESEGDQSFDVEKVLLEDEIWNVIRLDYQSLPVGDIEIIPGIFAARLLHRDIKPQQATATLEQEEKEATYSLKYTSGRALQIHFSTEFPYQVQAWEETYKGLGGKSLTTTATLKKTLYTDYWNKHDNAHSYLRDSLQLN